MSQVNFKYADEKYIYQPLLDAVNQVCIDYKKDCLCASGYRSIEKQKIINSQVLKEHKGAYRLINGAVYTRDGKCWASAYGKSNHCFCIAMDITDEWFKALTNTELKKYGLYKPMAHEPWHVQLLKHQGITQAQKEAIRDSVLKGELHMDIKEFQAMTGLFEDGIPGPITQAKAKEVRQICQTILGNNFENATDVIINTQNEPSRWLNIMKRTPHMDDFIMNIVKELGGKN